MELLFNRPNLLYSVLVRNHNKHLLNGKLLRPIYHIKLIKSLTVKTVTNHKIEYTINGKKHRLDGPAGIYNISKENPLGTIQHWYKDGKKHRLDGPAVITCISKENPLGTYQEWHKEGKQHRLDGPTVILCVSKENPLGKMKVWYKEGKKHRLNGPAIINEDHTVEYWENGIRIRMI